MQLLSVDTTATMEVDVKWLYLLLKAIAVSVDARLGVNVALKRPAYQSGTAQLQSGLICYASYANDGNHDPIFTHGSCSMTKPVINPWWAVDLGVPLYVHSIKFTNRENFAHRAANFIIGLTNASPAVTAPTLWNYTVCGQYPGQVGEGATVNLTCACNLPAYRYLIVQFPATTENLKAGICELEVYVRSWQWANHPGQKMINKVASIIQVERSLQCMINCTLSPSCDSYNYRPSDKTCELNTHDTPLIANSTDMVTDSTWTWWSPIFCTLV